MNFKLNIIMSKTKEIKKLKKRIKALESIITSNSITLVNSSNPNEKIIIKYENDNFSTLQQTTSTQETLLTHETLKN